MLKMSKKVKVLVVAPHAKPYVQEIIPNLKAFQSIVDGTIEAVYPFEDESIFIYCNEEGKLTKLPLNRAMRDEEGEMYDVIAGTFVICKDDGKGGTASLSEEEIIKYLTMFHKDENWSYRD